MMSTRALSFTISIAMVCTAAGGPADYGICQTGCNALAVACYAGMGLSFGVGAAPACDAALGVCMAACVAAGLTPTP